MTTDKQVSFITSLVRTRWQSLGAPDMQTALAAILPQLDQLDNKGCSNLIDRIKGVAEQVDPDMPQVVAASARKGVNSNTQPCSSCGFPVIAGTGYYYEDYVNVSGQWVKGGWKVHHKVNQCETGAPAPAPIAVSEGFYKVGEQIIMVYRTGNNRLAGKVMNDAGKFKYQPGAAATAACGRRLTWEEAAEYGKLHKRCALRASPLAVMAHSPTRAMVTHSTVATARRVPRTTGGHGGSHDHVRHH